MPTFEHRRVAEHTFCCRQIRVDAVNFTRGDRAMTNPVFSAHPSAFSTYNGISEPTTIA